MRLQTWWIAALVALSGTSCRSGPASVRAVEHAPRVTLEPWQGVPRPAATVVEPRRVSNVDTTRPQLRAVLGEPRKAPRWGGPQLDLGAGQAPFDDAVPDNALLPEASRGFSDSLIQLTIEEPVAPGLRLVGGVAAMRYQDEPLLDGLREAEFAWIAVGIAIRF